MKLLTFKVKKKQLTNASGDEFFMSRHVYACIMDTILSPKILRISKYLQNLTKWLRFYLEPLKMNIYYDAS